MTDRAAWFTPLEKILSVLLLAALIGLGSYIVMKEDSEREIASEKEEAETLEAVASDVTDVATFREYGYTPVDRLPGVEGDSRYSWDPEEKILRFSYNIWIGWLPVIAANRGTRPTPDSIFYRKYGFRVEMVLIDNPVAARKAFGAGEIHTLWGTVDMMALLASDMMRDTRAAPRIVQQIDWSEKGDAMVVRRPIKRIQDLRDKTVALARYSPSEYYFNLLLLSAGLRPDDIRVRYTTTPFEAAAALAADVDVDACISRAPDVYRIPDRVEKTQILPSRSGGGRLIADVYAVRADFARDHPEIVEGLIAGIFEGMDYVRQRPEQGARWMADAFGMKPGEVLDMRRDAHSANFPENIQFFMNSANPTNFEQTWKNASSIYREFGSMDASIPFDQVMDFTFLLNLRAKGMLADQRDESIAAFTPSSLKRISSESPSLTQAVRIGFFPNSVNPYESARDEQGNALAGRLYDPNVQATLNYVGWLSNQLDRATILIEGHADSSMKGRVPAQAVRELSLSRAKAVRRALVQKFRFDPKKISIEIKGRGWDVPADSGDPDNQMLNRRVEISVFSAGNSG